MCIYKLIKKNKGEYIVIKTMVIILFIDVIIFDLYCVALVTIKPQKAPDFSRGE